MSNLPEILTRQESDMIDLLIIGENITDIAKTLNVHRNTIYSWMNKDYVKAELGRRRQELTRQGNAVILRDINTYINNIKALANDPSDKRTALAANQYLLNRVYGNPKELLEIQEHDDVGVRPDMETLTEKLKKFKKIKL